LAIGRTSVALLIAASGAEAAVDAHVHFSVLST
jgi:hypothetical protein